MRSSSESALRAIDALRDDEIASLRLFLRIGWIVGVAALVGVWRLPGDPALARVVVVAIVATATWSVVCYLRADRSAMVTALAVACVVSATLANLYVGYFSAAPLIVALGMYFFCRIARRREAIAIYAVTALAHVAIALLVITGVIRDPAYAPVPPDVPLEATLVGLFGVQLAYGIAFWLARSTRAASLHAIEELQRATRTAALRLVQVDELRDDLDRALKIGGPGRFTNAVVGDWELGAVLGRGGMGEVYEARHVDDGREAAVKLLRRELIVDHHHVERFLREVRAVSALESPHVVRVFDSSSAADVVPFLAMERLHGHTLASTLRGTETLSPDAIVDVVRQVAGALERARAADIVHRDIKPHNLFRTDAGTWKLLDFGAAAFGVGTGTLTSGVVIGTPGYMAPEQADGGDVDHRADLYALVAVTYRCVTGRVPFGGHDPAAVLYLVAHEMPVRPSALVPLPADIDRFFAIGLAKRPTDRFQTTSELVDALVAAFGDALPREARARADRLARDARWAELAPPLSLQERENVTAVQTVAGG